jgi:hypothetical protein
MNSSSSFRRIDAPLGNFNVNIITLNSNEPKKRREEPHLFTLSNGTRLSLYHPYFHYDSGGQTYSYCGLSDAEVCCFIPANAKPVGLLPLPNPHARANCGNKGVDGQSDGAAEMAEWPWHVSHLHRSHSIYINQQDDTHMTHIDIYEKKKKSY